jgi:hypothetical protein
VIRRLGRALLGVTLASGAGAGAGAASAQALCAEDKVTVIGDWGQARFTVAVADTPAERAQGLMFVEEMGLLEGMLFVYEAPATASFWMRNTLIPLDMLFASPDGTVTRVHENAVPLDETSIPGGDGVQFVLEINGGMAAQLGIEAGDLLQHPAIGPDAAAPCG